jgi:hypothetical protein
MEKEKNQMEITLKVPIGKNIFPADTTLNLLSQLAQITSELGNYNKKKIVNGSDYDDPEDFFHDIISYQLWKFLAKSFSTLGLAMCFNSPQPLIDLEEIFDDFSSKLRKEYEKENQNKEEEIESFLKENPDLN